MCPCTERFRRCFVTERKRQWEVREALKAINHKLAFVTSDNPAAAGNLPTPKGSLVVASSTFSAHAFIESSVRFKMAMVKLCFVILLVIFCLFSVSCLPEPGRKDLKFNKEQEYGFFQKTMNKGYKVAVKGNCNGTTGKFPVQWYLLVVECAGWFESIKDHEKKSVIKNVLRFPVYRNHSLYGKGVVNCPSGYLL
ncbi:hypothetical protein P5673_024300, partial [Acropora cervicornis]